jgi:hypothetical protein
LFAVVSGRLRTVHAHNAAVAPDQADSGERPISRPAAQFQHPHARPDLRYRQEGAGGGGKRPALQIQAGQLVPSAAEL